VALPSKDSPFVLYSSQTRHSIKQTLLRALCEARSSIYLSVYGLSDPDILKMLERQGNEGVSVSIEYDPSASLPLASLLHAPVRVMPMKTRGLMHRKIAVIDHARVFLGSANFTPTSLRHHGNLLLGLYHEGLARYLEAPFFNHFTFSLEGMTGELFLLPDPSGNCVSALLESLRRAKRRIHIAMFTFTHEGLIEELIHAQERGVEVRVAVDYYTARGASKKALERLSQAGITPYLSQGQELLHYKWAVIDETELIMGSANWTRAAFAKNQDFLLFLSPLAPPNRKFFRHLFEIIEAESSVTE
jgi:phosphatidylserine/phosphatidylglycerophosphate/cardiolipin synthase-like enzyme